jgi:hypothetical protein
MSVKIRVAKHTFHRLGFDQLVDKAPTKREQAVERKAIEKQTQQSCASFLINHKWRRIRNNPILASDENGNVFSASEPGMPDELYLYYFGSKDRCSAAMLGLWIEYKKPGEIEKPARTKTRQRQMDWQRRERLWGAEIWEIDDYNVFQDRYFKAFGWLHSGSRARGQTELFGSAAVDLFSQRSS